jgi:hypothetical protein
MAGRVSARPNALKRPWVSAASGSDSDMSCPRSAGVRALAARAMARASLAKRGSVDWNE